MRTHRGRTHLGLEQSDDVSRTTHSLQWHLHFGANKIRLATAAVLIAL